MNIIADVLTGIVDWRPIRLRIINQPPQSSTSCSYNMAIYNSIFTSTRIGSPQSRFWMHKQDRKKENQKTRNAETTELGIATKGEINFAIHRLFAYIRVYEGNKKQVKFE